MSVAELPAHLADQAVKLRPVWVPRRNLEPHERSALKPALRPLLPPDADLRVRTLNETEVVVGATLGGHRLVLRTRCPSKIFDAADWAAEIAARLQAWRPPTSAETTHG